MGQVSDAATAGVDYARAVWNLGLEVGRMAVWADDPIQQIVANLVIVVVMMLSSSVGFVVGIPIALAAMVFLGIGIVRLIGRAV
jgi:hypothetical protein